MKSYRDLRTALAEADWEKILPGLTAYAERKLCWRGWGIRVSRPSGNDIVNQAIERCLSGDRQWSFDSQCDDLEVFLKGVMKSLVHSAKKSAARQKLNLFVDNPRPPVATCADGDPDLEAYYVAVTEEETRGDVASHLSWPSTRISAARTKLQRRLIVQFPALFCGLKKRRAS
jgi:hypothetical protein